MKAQDLKNSILQLAMQGKLVEQRAEEGTARELIEQIELEKERLIKEKKLREERPLPKIAEEELPFEIPESWEWVRLSRVVDVRDGTHDSPRYYETGIPLITSKNISNGRLSFDNVKYISKEDAKKINERSNVDTGDILFAMIGSIGNPVIVNKDRDFCVKNVALFKVFLKKKLCVKYLYWFLFFEQFAIKRIASGGVQSFVSLKVFRNYLFPLPPYEEQKRIVEKVEELLPYIEQYDKAYSKLEVLNKKFPEDMQKSILRYAMQGKLVGQKSEEGNADELYEQIVAEKARLIKEGKIKKEKFLHAITEDEIPYEIPDSWKWVSIKDIAFVTKLAGFEYTKYMADTIMSYGEVPIVRAKNIKPNSFVENKNEFITMEISEQLSRCALDNKCVLMTFIGAGIGEVAVFDNIRRNHLAPNVAKIVPYVDINYFLMYYLMSAVGQMQIFQYMKRTAQPSLSMEVIRKVLVPLPPLAEQKRIVQEIEEMMPYCKKLSQI